MKAGRVLVIEDERDILDLVDFNLTQAGFEVLRAMDGLEGLRRVGDGKPDLVVLDLMLPGLEGQEVCRRMKQNPATRAIPVLMLTAMASETDRIVGFELGADDYLTKPFSPRELVLRVKAVLRRGQPDAEEKPVVRQGQLEIDQERHVAMAGGEQMDLTATEFKLLHHLVSRAGRVQTRQQLLEQVWGYGYDGYARTVDTHIRRLRKKLGSLSDCIETVRGIGYKFQEE